MKKFLTLFLLIWLLLPAACGAPSVEPGIETAVVPTETAAPTAIATPTLRPTTPPTATALPTATLLPTAIASPTPLPTATPLPTVPPTATPTAAPTVPANEMFDPQLPLAVVGVEPGDALNVREGPGADSAVIGTIPVGAQDVALIGNGRTVGTSVWAPVRYAGVEGWVNAEYLAEQFGTTPRDVALTAWEALDLLRDHDMPAFADMVHPELGVQFVPFTYISDENPRFSAEKVADLWDDDTVYIWGGNAATGDPIELTFRDYWAQHGYTVDYFRAPMIGYDTNMVPGGMIDNSRELYPDAHIVEFHYDGFNPEYEGLDYRTLRIVLTALDGDWYVVAVVDNQWTP